MCVMCIVYVSGKEGNNLFLLVQVQLYCTCLLTGRLCSDHKSSQKTKTEVTAVKVKEWLEMAPQVQPKYFWYDPPGVTKKPLT